MGAAITKVGNLHSTVVLLKVSTMAISSIDNSLFTFYCSSIKSEPAQIINPKPEGFTFYCSSIKSHRAIEKLCVR